MKKVHFILMILSLLLIAGCSTQVASEDKQGIITTFYPVEEITKAVVGDLETVEVIVPHGVDPHSYEPSVRDLTSYSSAKVFVTMEGFFGSIEEEIIEANDHLLVIKAIHDLELIEAGEDHHDDHGYEEEEHAHEEGEDHAHEEDHDDDHGADDHHDHGDYDPHVWLSIHNMEKMTEEITEKLSEIYPEHQEQFEANAQVYLEQLEVLEEEFTTTLASCTYDKALVNHKAFGYLAHEYGFEQISVAGFSPESEPTPATIQRVIDEAEEHGLQYVFSEGQIDPKVAQTIAAEIGGEVLELNPVKMTAGQDYFSLMRGNLQSLSTGLDCQS